MSPSDWSAELERTYSATFYDELDMDVRSAAETIVPILIEVACPSSVLDVGCGRGTWLSVFMAAGIDDVVGVDGPHVDTAALEIPREHFVAHDLREQLVIDRKFDLVLSLEVAEHLDPSLASDFISSLVRHGSAVLFSAAIPHQGGSGHVNEQWQSVWADHFADHGFVPIDAIRPRTWNDPRVAFWYSQNTILYVDPVALPDLALAHGVREMPLDVVHPEMYLRRRAATATAAPVSLRGALRQVPRAASRALRRRMPHAHEATPE